MNLYSVSFSPPHGGCFLHEPLLCQFYDGKVLMSTCTTLRFHLWRTDGFELLVTDGYWQLRLIKQYIAQCSATTYAVMNMPLKQAP